VTTELPSARELWESTPPSRRSFNVALLRKLPGAAQCYLGHAIAAGTPLASAVRLQMHGEIKLKGWYPFSEVWTF
jgi:hypothetical protein